MKQDEEHLRLLSIFHYVVAALAALGALFPVIYFIVGLIIVFARDKFPDHGQAPPVVLGWLLAIFALMLITFGWIFAALLATTGRFLAQRRHYTFCLFMAGLECIFMPFGTVLGVLTIVVLVRESVRSLFGAPSPPPPIVR